MGDIEIDKHPYASHGSSSREYPCTRGCVAASVIQGVKIGKGVIIGAGAAVVDDIPDNVTAVGVPAKVIKHHEGA